MIEHEFARRIAYIVNTHLQSWKKGNNEREPVSRFLKTYAVYLDDHITKEENFFDKAQREILSKEEEQLMYEEFRAVTAITTKLDEMIQLISSLEKRDWMKD